MIKNCSGTLLNELYVLTAAHCVEIEKGSVNFNTEFSSTESIMRVYFGFTDKSKAFQPNVIQNYERKIQKVIVHPKYDPMYLLNDLAILKLDKPIYRSANVDYLCLFDYDKTDQMVSQLKLYTAGWGSTVANHLNLFYPNVINYVDAIAFPMTFCKYIYPGINFDFKYLKIYFIKYYFKKSQIMIFYLIQQLMCVPAISSQQVKIHVMLILVVH